MTHWTNTLHSWIRHETAAYRLTTDRFGFYVLTRISDGASASFQGDDADLWRRNMDAIERCFHDEDPELRMNASFDCLCSGYDDILENAA